MIMIAQENNATAKQFIAACKCGTCGYLCYIGRYSGSRCCTLSIIDGYCYVVNLHFLGTVTCLVQYSRRLINILS